jgi:hypothetical protein
MSEFLLKGLDGGNPLGFLTAVGALRTTSVAYRGGKASLHWEKGEGGWRPMIRLSATVDENEWLESLSRELRAVNGCRAFALADNLNIPVEVYRRAAEEARDDASLGDRRYLDFLAAFGSEATEAELNGKKTGTISDTAFRTMSGAGHQHFLGTMRVFAKDTGTEHLRKALVQPWVYDDPLEKHTMRWDPTDDVRYALRWRDPSGDSSRKSGGSVWGANRLAIEALPLFPTAPTGGRLETTGFRLKRREGVFWTWPIWSTPLAIDPLRSLLALRELQELGESLASGHPEAERSLRERLNAMGVEEVMRCQRITQGKYRNLSMAWPA